MLRCTCSARRARRAILVPTIALLLVGMAAGASVAAPIVVRQTLRASGDDADARGKAIFKVRGKGSHRSGTLVVTAAKLERRSSLEVTIDGVRIGTLPTSGRGAGRARFRTAPRGDDQLLGIDPRGRTIALVGPGGAAVLAAGLPSKGLDPGDVRCCVPDDSGPECEDRTVAECAAQGGVDLGPGSCLPNPCGSSPTDPGGDIRCCLPDDSGPECEDRTVAECAAQGGVNIGAGSCAPNPCGTATPPVGGTATVEITCERRADRSKISVNGKGLASGSYRARVTSGANTATAGPRSTVGDEVEFDFDSAPDDVAAGATAIAGTFVQGVPPRVAGVIETAAGAVVAEATATCAER